MAKAKRITVEQSARLSEAIVAYRKLAIQCSNTAFNLAQAARDAEHRYESTFQLIRSFDRAESTLIEVLKDNGLFKSLADAPGDAANV